MGAFAQVDGRVTRLWKFFFRPASGTTDRLGFSIPMGDTLDQVCFYSAPTNHTVSCAVGLGDQPQFIYRL